MGIPAGVDKVTVTVSGLRNQAGNAAYSGIIWVTPSVETVHIPTGNIYTKDPIPVQMNDGVAVVELVASDADNMTVSNRHYTWDFSQVYDPNSQPVSIKSGNVFLPKVAPNVNYGTLLQVTNPLGYTMSYPAVASVAGLTGVVTEEQLVTILAGAIGGIPTFIGTVAPVHSGPYLWWDTSGGNLTLYLEDGA